MHRRKFIQAATLGFGSVFMPSIVGSKPFFNTGTTLSGFPPKIMKENKGDVLNVLGDIQTHKFAGKETGDQIVEWVSHVDPGVGIPPHIHSKEDEIFRIIKGQVEFMIGDQTIVLQAGDIVFAPRNVVHSWKVVGNQKAKMMVSAFPAGIEVMFRELARLSSQPPDFEKVAQICGKYGIRFVK